MDADRANFTCVHVQKPLIYKNLFPTISQTEKPPATGAKERGIFEKVTQTISSSWRPSVSYALQSAGEVKSITWAADIHLDFLTPENLIAFYDTVLAQKSDLVILAGDIEHGATTLRLPQSMGVANRLNEMQKRTGCSIALILGNHDFYFSSFAEVRQNVCALCKRSPSITYLHESGVHLLNQTTALIGVDGWTDSREGNFYASDLTLADFFAIKDFGLQTPSEIPTPKVKQQLEALGEASCAYVRQILPQAFEYRDHVIVVTHCPPFREASYHEGKVADDNGAPFFVNKGLGSTLLEIMKTHTNKSCLVLCGHTHSRADYAPLPNLRILTTGSDYKKPVLEKLIVTA